MKILENEIIVKYDTAQKKLTTYRRVKGADSDVINTSYSLADLKLKGIHEAGRIIGEDILISLKGTREELIDK